MNDRSEMSRLYGLIGLLAVLAGPPAFAEVMDDVAPLQQRWAEVQYQTPEDARAAAFEQLATQAQQVVAQNKGAPEPLIWQGIILSTWAGAKGGMGALKLCKQAKASFEEAMKIDKLVGEDEFGNRYYVQRLRRGSARRSRALGHLQNSVRSLPGAAGVARLAALHGGRASHSRTL